MRASALPWLGVVAILTACSSAATLETPTTPAETPTVEVNPSPTSRPLALPTQAADPAVGAPGPIPTALPSTPLPGRERGEVVLQLPLGEGFDLDQATAIAIPLALLDDEGVEEGDEDVVDLSGDLNIDLYYRLSALGGIEEAVIAPDPPALLAVWGEAAPSFEDCRGAGLSDEEILLATLPMGSYLCFQTDQERVGFIRLDDAWLDPQNGWEVSLELSYTIWESAGAVRQEALRPVQAIFTQPLGEEGKDLDHYGNQRAIDLRFEVLDEGLVQLSVAPAARLAWWGTSLPTYANCAGLTLGGGPEVVEAQPRRPVYYCYQTSEGRLGRFAFRGVVEDNEAAEGASFDQARLDVAADTWGTPPDRYAVGLAQQEMFLRLPSGMAFDFDQNSTFSGPALFEVLSGTAGGEAALVPNAFNEAAGMALWGMEAPDFDACLTATLTQEAIPITSLTVGTHICLQTDWNQVSTMKVEGVYPESPDGKEYRLDLRYTIWRIEGEVAVGEPMVYAPIIGLSNSGGRDLDHIDGVGAADIAFRWAVEEVELVPVEGARLGYWGTTFPSYADCNSLALSEQALGVEAHPFNQTPQDGLFFCYETNEGRLGRLVYRDVIGGQFIFDAETWNAP